MKKSYNILGFDVTSLSADELIELTLSSSKLDVINTINPHSYIVSKSDLKFKESLCGSDFLVPDGSGIIFAAWTFGITLNKVAGFDVFESAMNYLDSIGGRVFFLGSTEFVLKEIRKKSAQDYPGVTVGFFSPPYKDEFTEDEIDSFIDVINNFEPDVIFIGLTAPKQEKLILNMKGRLTGKLISGIGAVFDFYAGTIRRPSRFWTNIHLEWLIRLLGEPKRLWRRNFISTPLFLFDLLKIKLKN